MWVWVWVWVWVRAFYTVVYRSIIITCTCLKMFARRLRSEVDASRAENARLEAELSKQTASAAARLAELQDSFTAKVCVCVCK